MQIQTVRSCVNRDASIMGARIEDCALIHTMAGDLDTALDRIEELLSTPSFFSVLDLEMDPRWNPLHSHPRYQEIIDKYG